MILDDGGDATHLMLKKYPAMFKLIKGMHTVFIFTKKSLKIGHIRF